MDRAKITSFSSRIRGHAVAGVILLASAGLAAGDALPRDAGLATAGAQLDYALPAGVSSFVIRLGNPEARGCVTFVNKNPAAEGRFSIAVSERPLAANSPLWSPVEGTIPFRHKRRFALSLVGVEANYVRLTFEVDGLPKTASAGENSSLP